MRKTLILVHEFIEWDEFDTTHSHHIFSNIELAEHFISLQKNPTDFKCEELEFDSMVY